VSQPRWGSAQPYLGLRPRSYDRPTVIPEGSRPAPDVGVAVLAPTTLEPALVIYGPAPLGRVACHTPKLQILECE
jgi:hypothetical protein